MCSSVRRESSCSHATWTSEMSAGTIIRGGPSSHLQAGDSGVTNPRVMFFRHLLFGTCIEANPPTISAYSRKAHAQCSVMREAEPRPDPQLAQQSAIRWYLKSMLWRRVRLNVTLSFHEDDRP